MPIHSDHGFDGNHAERLLSGSTATRLAAALENDKKESKTAEACAALVDKLYASSRTIKAAVVSADMFLALAKPATASVALKLIEEMDLVVGDEIITPLLAGQCPRVPLCRSEDGLARPRGCGCRVGRPSGLDPQMEEHEQLTMSRRRAKGHDMVALYPGASRIRTMASRAASTGSGPMVGGF